MMYNRDHVTHHPKEAPMAKEPQLIKSIAEALSFQTEEGSAYGIYDNYWFSVNQDDNRSILHIDTAVRLNEKQRTRLKDSLHTLSKKSRFSFHLEGPVLTLLVFVGLSRKKNVERVRTIIHEIADGLAFLRGVPVCHRCSAPGNHDFYLKGDSAVLLCPDCAKTLSTGLAEEKRQLESNGTYGRGFFGALGGALLGALLWVLLAFFGWPAAVSGIAMAAFALRGYRKAGGRVGAKMPKLIVLAVLIALLLAVMVEIALILSLSEDLEIGFLQGLATAPFIMLDLRTFYWLSLLTGLAFATIGSTVRFRKMRKEALFLPYRLKKLA